MITAMQERIIARGKGELASKSTYLNVLNAHAGYK